ncbi:MAG: hypothetical protein LBT30_02415 [Clostridiales bacterium]|jgi:hypothetical protein|nr:hypothetical protein [Clostridiales bacterium]
MINFNDVVAEEEAEKRRKNSRIQSPDFLLDIKILLQNNYIVSFDGKQNALRVFLNNGQTFLLTANETKKDVL